VLFGLRGFNKIKPIPLWGRIPLCNNLNNVTGRKMEIQRDIAESASWDEYCEEQDSRNREIANKIFMDNVYNRFTHDFDRLIKAQDYAENEWASAVTFFNASFKTLHEKLIPSYGYVLAIRIIDSVVEYKMCGIVPNMYLVAHL
jgi:hypothetical protein